MADGSRNQVDIEIRTRKTGNGEAETGKALDGLSRKAQEVRAMMGRIGTALSGAGLVGLAKMVGDALVNAFNSAWNFFTRKQSEANETALANAQAASASLAAAYARATEEIARQKSILEEINAIEKARLENQRQLEDETLKLQEAQETAAVAMDDPLRAEKLGVITAKYASVRANRSGARGVSDAESAKALLEKQIAMKGEERESALGEYRDFMAAASEKNARAQGIVAATTPSASLPGWMSLPGVEKKLKDAASWQEAGKTDMQDAAKALARVKQAEDEIRVLKERLSVAEAAVETAKMAERAGNAVAANGSEDAGYKQRTSEEKLAAEEAQRRQDEARKAEIERELEANRARRAAEEAKRDMATASRSDAANEAWIAQQRAEGGNGDMRSAAERIARESASAEAQAAQMIEAATLAISGLADAQKRLEAELRAINSRLGRAQSDMTGND